MMENNDSSGSFVDPLAGPTLVPNDARSSVEQDAPDRIHSMHGGNFKTTVEDSDEHDRPDEDWPRQAASQASPEAEAVTPETADQFFYQRFNKYETDFSAERLTQYPLVNATPCQQYLDCYFISGKIKYGVMIQEKSLPIHFKLLEALSNELIAIGQHVWVMQAQGIMKKIWWNMGKGTLKLNAGEVDRILDLITANVVYVAQTGVKGIDLTSSNLGSMLLDIYTKNGNVKDNDKRSNITVVVELANRNEPVPLYETWHFLHVCHMALDWDMSKDHGTALDRYNKISDALFELVVTEKKVAVLEKAETKHQEICEKIKELLQWVKDCQDLFDNGSLLLENIQQYKPPALVKKAKVAIDFLKSWETKMRDVKAGVRLTPAQTEPTPLEREQADTIAKLNKEISGSRTSLTVSQKVVQKLRDEITVLGEIQYNEKRKYSEAIAAKDAATKELIENMKKQKDEATKKVEELRNYAKSFPTRLSQKKEECKSLKEELKESAERYSSLEDQLSAQLTVYRQEKDAAIEDRDVARRERDDAKQQVAQSKEKIQALQSRLLPKAAYIQHSGLDDPFAAVDSVAIRRQTTALQEAQRSADKETSNLKLQLATEKAETLKLREKVVALERKQAETNVVLEEQREREVALRGLVAAMEEGNAVMRDHLKHIHTVTAPYTMP